MTLCIFGEGDEEDMVLVSTGDFEFGVCVLLSTKAEAGNGDVGFPREERLAIGAKRV